MRVTCVVAVVISLVIRAFATDGHDEAINEAYGEDPYGGGGGGSYGDPYGGYDGGYGGSDSSKSIAKEVDSLEELNELLREESKAPTVIGYFDITTHQADLDSFKEFASADGGAYVFLYTTNKEILEEKKYDGCAVVVHPSALFVSEKHKERSKFRYPAKNIGKVEHLRDFVRQKALPVVGEVTPQTLRLYEQAGLPVLTVFAAVDMKRNPKGYTYIANRVRKVAAEHKGKVLFNVANTQDFAAALTKHYGFSDVHSQELMVGLADGPMYYAMDPAATESGSKFSTEALRSFVQAFLDGSLVGRERLPEKAPSGHGDEGEGDDDGSESAVVTLTDANFREAVTDSAADVLVEFYAPWCGHCKQLKPEYKRAAAAFTNDAGVTLAAMDATAHTVPSEFNVEGYPTLIFVPANNKKGQVSYEGPRDEQSIVQWLREHRTTTTST